MNAYAQGVVNAPVASLRYGWNTATQIQIGSDEKTMPAAENYVGSIVTFDNTPDSAALGWNMKLNYFTVDGQIINEDYDAKNLAVMLSNYPFIDIPTAEWNYLDALLPAGFMKNTYGDTTFWYTNDTLVCMDAIATMPDLTFVLNGYNFTISSEAYILNFIDNMSANLF